MVKAQIEAFARIRPNNGYFHCLNYIVKLEIHSIRQCIILREMREY